MAPTDDAARIRALVDLFVEGWNAADGAACARPFAADADFFAVTGLKARGRDLIGRAHAEILATVFRGTRLASTVEAIRFVRPDVALADVTFRLTLADGAPFMPGHYPGHSSAGVLAVREGDAWAIVSFRNMVPFGRPTPGPVEQSLTKRPDGS